MDPNQQRVPVDLGIDGISDAVRIGEGGYGTVYRARQEAFDRTVAVKVLRAPAFDEEVRRRFDRECRALGSLSGHPHIVAVHSSGVAASGLCYLVMEHLPGGTLAQRVASGGPLPPAEVAGIGVKLAGALARAHSDGVLHRDLKPENVLVSAYGEPQLVDFGVAHVEGATATQSGSITGTLAHAAPEVLSGERGQEAADVYSLASTLYALLAGQAPFVRPGEVAFFPLMARVLSEPPPDLRERGVPVALWQALEQALVKDPGRRTTSAAALAEDLRAALGSAGTSPVPLAAPLPVPSDPSDDHDQPDVVTDDPGTVSVRGAWAKAASPSPPPPLLPRVPVAPTLADRLQGKGRLGLVAGALALTALVVVLAVILARPSGDSTDVAASDSVRPTTTQAPAVTSVVPSTAPPTTPPPPPTATGPALTAPPVTAGSPPPVSSPVTQPTVNRPPPVVGGQPPGIDYPVCTVGDFEVQSETDPARRLVMRQRTCAEELADGSVKASMTVQEVRRSSDDRIEAVYRVELRHCDTDAALSSVPAGPGPTTATGSPVLSAETGSFRPSLYAYAKVDEVKLTTGGISGDTIWTSRGLIQQTPGSCP